MSDSFLPVFSAVIAALKANGALIALVPAARIYSDVPDNPTFPFIICSMTSQPNDTKTESGMIHTLQVSAFSRSKTLADVAAIRSAVYNVLHKQEASFTAAGVYGILFSGTSFLLKESDGITYHSPMQFRIMAN